MRRKTVSSAQLSRGPLGSRIPHALKALQPASEPVARVTHGAQADLQSSQVAVERLLVCRQSLFDALRRSGMRRVVNLLRSPTVTHDCLKARREIGTYNAAREPVAVAEEQGLELMHHDIRDESARVEAPAHLAADIGGDGCLDGLRPLRRLTCAGNCPTRPSCLAILRHSVVIDHGGRDAPRILPQVMDNVPARRRPRFDSATPVASTGTSHQPCGNQRIPSSQKMRSENLLDKILFGLTLDMYQQPPHPAVSFESASRAGRPPISFFSQSCPRL